MSYVLSLQNDDDASSHGDRMPSTWSLIGCASTLSIGAC